MQFAHHIYGAANAFGKLAFILFIHSAWFAILYAGCVIWQWVAELVNPTDYDDSNY